jgi:glycolate oxidase FAD binding subunit
MNKASAFSSFDSFPLGDHEILSGDTLSPQWKESLEKAIAPSSPFPSYLLSPATQEALSEVVKRSGENHWVILPCGSGSKLNWGGLVKNPQLVVSTQRLNRIIDHAVDDLTVTVESGVKLAELQAILREKKQFLPLDPAYPDAATIGGIVATADTGSWRQRYGGVRDLVLGLSFVRADGEIAKAGGRVVKNVAGYDLMKLFTGSFGTLGIISQVTFRLYPLPEASITLVVTGEKNAISSTTQTLRNSGLTPTRADLLSPSLVNYLQLEQEMGLILRFQSIPESTTAQTTQIESLAQQLGLQVSIFQDEEESNLWQRLQNIMRLPGTKESVTCKIGVLPTAIVNLLEQLDKLTHKQGFGMINISSGLGYLHLDAGMSQISKLRLLCQQEKGFLSILEAPSSLKQQLEPWGYTGNSLELMQKIKQKFDSNNIFNPGKLFQNKE